MLDKSLIKFALLSLILVATSCTQWTGEVIESQYQFPIIPDPTYSFRRQGSSSVDIQPAERAYSASGTLYARFLRTAYILNTNSWTELNTLFDQGGNNEVALRPLIATSPIVSSSRGQILADFDAILDAVRRSGAYFDGTYSVTRYNRQAERAQSGYIGYGQGDDDRVFALPNGLVPAEQYQGMILGAIYLDKILNEYLNESDLQDTSLIQAHEDQRTTPGRNYTELEHRWDLAYGYYQQLQKNVQSNGLPHFNGSETKLFNAFALGRLAITEYRYEEAIEHLLEIRELLPKVVAARAIFELTGRNTLANLQEDPRYAFRFISRGLGYVYALQFTRTKDGKAYLNRNDVEQLLRPFTSSNEGLWAETISNDLSRLSTSITEIFGLPTE